MQASSETSVRFYDTLWATERRVDQHHKCRIHAIARMLERVPPPADRERRLLELGCGSGMVAALLARYGAVTGIDQSEVGIAAARARTRGTFVVGMLPEIALDEGDFDVCVMSQVIEHFADANQALLLRNAARKVKAGGHLIVTTPNRPVSSRMQFRPGELQPIENWLEPAALHELLRRTGWRPVSTRFAFNFLPVWASRDVRLRALRFAAYDVLRLRNPIEDALAHRGRGDCTVVLAEKG